jgi:hypothetical protein
MRRAKKDNRPQPESVADFKLRLSSITRGQNGGEFPPVKPAPSALVRQPGDEGYNPPMVRVPDHKNGGATLAPRGGAALQIWQRKQWGD